jgi:phage recombination protein Bet
MSEINSNSLIAYDAEFTANGELTQTHFTILEKAGIVPKGTPSDIISLFAYVCKEKGLSPFSKEIYLLGYKNKNGGMDYSVITGIDGYRKLAHRSGAHAGVDSPRFDPMPDGSFKTLAQLMKEGGAKPDTVCEVVTYRIVQGVRVPFCRPVIFKNFSTGTNKWHPQYGMPEHMLIKCAEAASLRAGFPQETSGVNTEDEFGNVSGTTQAEEQANMTLGEKVSAPTSELTPAQQAVVEDAKAKLATMNTKDEITAFWKSQTWGAKGSILYEKVMGLCVERGNEISKSSPVEFSDDDKEVIETTETVIAMYKTVPEIDDYLKQSTWGGEGTALYNHIRTLCETRKAAIAKEGGAK